MNWIKHLLFLLAGLILGAFFHAQYAETKPSRADMEAIGIAQARENSRIQFERDIGFAEAQLAGAISAMKNLTTPPAPGTLSTEEIDGQAQELKLAAESVRQKRARVSFLRSEAQRLNIPVVSPTENEPVQQIASTEPVEVQIPDLPPAPVPDLITLTEPVEIKDPSTAEVIRFGRGRTFRPLAVSNDQIRVRYQELEISIPIASTDVR